MQFPSDRELFSYLNNCEMDHFSLIVVAVHSKISLDSRKNFGPYISGEQTVPAPATPERTALTKSVLEQIRYFGSHSIAYGLRKVSPFHKEPGVSYAELLREAEEVIFEKFSPKLKPAKINSVVGREHQIATLLLSRTLAEIPDVELQSMLADTGLEMEACKKAISELRDPAISGTVLLALGKILGKKTVRDLLLGALVAIAGKVGQKEAAKHLALQIAKRLPQKAFLRLSNYVGWALLVWDAYLLGGPAKRITIPCVATIAVLRTADRLKN